MSPKTQYFVSLATVNFKRSYHMHFLINKTFKAIASVNARNLIQLEESADYLTKISIIMCCSPQPSFDCIKAQADQHLNTHLLFTNVYGPNQTLFILLRVRRFATFLFIYRALICESIIDFSQSREFTIPPFL